MLLITFMYYTLISHQNALFGTKSMTYKHCKDPSECRGFAGKDTCLYTAVKRICQQHSEDHTQKATIYVKHSVEIFFTRMSIFYPKQCCSHVKCNAYKICSKISVILHNSALAPLPMFNHTTAQSRC